MGRMDAPHLGDIDITFFAQPTFDASQLGRFVERSDFLAWLGLKAGSAAQLFMASGPEKWRLGP
jgi:hypothetical protein